jgi:integrase
MRSAGRSSCRATSRTTTFAISSSTYTNNGRKSLGDLKTTRLPRLDAVFGGTKAIDITSTSVERYKTLRLKEKAAPATINRELASLKRMFRLGLRQGMVATMPYIAMLAERNVRKGFFELDQFQAILKHLPSEYHALFEIAYITGWRTKSELLTRQWRHVDFGGRGMAADRRRRGEGRDRRSRVPVHDVDARGARAPAQVHFEGGEEGRVGEPPVGVLPAGRRPDPHVLRAVVERLQARRHRAHPARLPPDRGQESRASRRAEDDSDGDDRPQNGVDLPAVQHR